MVAGLSANLTAAEFEAIRAHTAGISPPQLPPPGAVAIEMLVASVLAQFEPSQGGKAEGFDASIAAARRRLGSPRS